MTEMDFRIMKGVLSENVYYSKNLNNFMTDIDNKDSENRNEDRVQDFGFEIYVKVRVILKEKAFMSSKL
jgi:hypothetical protein